MKRIIEKNIEQYFIDQIHEKGGITYKFNSMGNNGVPDRVAVLKGHTFFVEFKAPGKTLRPLQEHVLNDLRHHGADVYWADSTIIVDSILRVICEVYE